MAESLKDKATSGVMWKSAEKMFGQIIHFVVGIAMARLLDPSDYGVVGLLAIFFAVAGTFQDSGFGMALIQKKKQTQADYSTVFFFSLIISVVIYAIFFDIT